MREVIIAVYCGTPDFTSLEKANKSKIKQKKANKSKRKQTKAKKAENENETENENEYENETEYDYESENVNENETENVSERGENRVKLRKQCLFITYLSLSRNSVKSFFEGIHRNDLDSET